MPRSLTLSFELLKTFVTLIRSGGDAGRAMRALGLNQPAISKRLHPLQHAGSLLERPWLTREGKTWRLTEEGRRVWPAVIELVDRLENFEAFLGGGEGGPEILRFACGQQMAAGPVRDALRAFRRDWPGARLRISTLRGRARIEGVAGGTIDLAVVTHDEPAIREIARRPLLVEPLAVHHLVLACARGAPWERSVRALPKAGAPAEALASVPLVLPEPDAGVRRALDEVLRRRDVWNRLDIALEVGGWATILGYVRDGLGVGVVSESALADPTGLIVRRLDPEAFPPIEPKLIGRRRAGDAWDLSEAGMRWREALRRTIGRT